MTNVFFIAAATSKVLGLLLVTRHGRALTYALGDLVEAARSTLLIARSSNPQPVLPLKVDPHCFAYNPAQPDLPTNNM